MIKQHSVINEKCRFVLSGELVMFLHLMRCVLLFNRRRLWLVCLRGVYAISWQTESVTYQLRRILSIMDYHRATHRVCVYAQTIDYGVGIELLSNNRTI